MGAGYIVIPYLQDTKVRVSFNNIKINTDYQFIEGIIETDYDPTWGEIASIAQAFNNIENLLNNWTGSEEDIQQLVAQQAYINDEIEGALNGNVLSEDEINNIKKDKSGFDQSISNLIEEGSNPSNENINAVQHTKDKLKEYELEQNLENDSQDAITGDGYFDGIIKFSVPDKEITKNTLDNPLRVDIEALKSKEEEGEEYFNAAWNNLKPGKTLIVSASNKESIDEEADTRKIKQQFANIGFNEYLLWIHYDFKLNEIKYKVDFGDGYYSGTDITKAELAQLYNDILSYDLKEAIGSSIVQISESMDTLLEEYKAYIPQLNKELIAGYSTYDVLKIILDFSKNCGENYQSQEKGIVPRCLWDTEAPLALNTAYYAGFVDAAWEIGELGVDLLKLKESWDPLSPYFNTEEAALTREQTIEVLLMIQQLFIDPEKRDQSWETVKVEVEKYVDETLDINAQARYNQGKLIFEVASAFFGITEVKAFVKTGKITSTILQGLTKIPGNLARLFRAIPGKLKKLENNVLAYILSANTYIEIARYTDEGTVIIDDWVNTGEEIIAKIDNITVNDEFTDALELIKRSNGRLGWRLAFKEGLERSAEIVNKYFINLRNSSPPYKVGTKTKDFLAKAGDYIYVVEEFNEGVPKMGGWGSSIKYNTLSEVREKLALITKFKNPDVKGGLVIRMYKVIKDLPSRKGIVGEQIDDITGELLEGGDEQIEFLVDMSEGKWEEFFEELDDKIIYLK